MNALDAYEIRVLDEGDIGPMRGLLDCFGEVFDDSDTYCSAQPDDRYLAALLSDGSFFAIVALEDGAVVGGLVAYELRKFEQARSEFCIYDLGVLEPHRRRGIGTALIERLKLLARDRGAWIIYVQADLGDDPAIALYSRLGTREDVLHFDIPPG
ncbi:MAG: AAC(3)-I family aminoglycoside N-acetyltransferase [Actinobacteria bacterium]|nr:MAG: AAC(3)-I family aminoglycoside N-acetyltransferase [Actinomycetota bacterium]